MDDTHKICYECKELKLRSEFNKKRSRPDGLNDRCKICDRLHFANYIKAHPRPHHELTTTIGEKQCTNADCKQWYPTTTEFFSRDKNRKDGLFPQCKFCQRAYHKAHHSIPDVRERRQTYLQTYYRRPENKAHHRAYNRAYYNQPEHREQRRVYGSVYHLTHRQNVHYRQQREFYRKRTDVKEHLNALRRSHYSQPEYRVQQRAYHKAYHKRSDIRERYREKERTYVEARRARRQSVAGSHTAQQIRDLLKRQKYTCYYCAAKFEMRSGKHIYHIDHTFPLSRVAGTDIPANDISYLVLACPSCNSSKGDKFPWEFKKGGRLL